ncbi:MULTISPECIES: DUF4347 domain-containing protein [unclassified Microcoleus]|uniref:DUF4347 domain-containing protein n=1 Tax=unclassified Microcoleus TaxID=2642155 RepID=UPI002FD0FE37
MMNKEVIFADSSVQDYQSLLQGIDGAEIVILKENLSAIDQITQALADRKDIEAVHILSHGSEGSFQLGSEILNENKLENFSTQIKQWGNALTANGDILLYACDVATGETGLNFVKRLNEITGADVAASNNITGSAAKGGDGELEVKFGEIETQPLNFANYNYTLAGLTGTADSKGINVSATPTSTAIEVLANDTGTGRLSVNSIVTGPTHGTAIINDSIYVGGWFTSIGGQIRNKIAKLNSDGTVDTAFNPNADRGFSAIAIDSSGNLIVSGAFTSIGGQTHNHIAKLNPTTGAADTTFNPNANDGDSISEIAIDSSGNLIVGGSFITFGSQSYTYTYIKKLNPTTGAADTTFNSNANFKPNANDISEIAIDSSGNLIVGGFFTTIAGQSYIAKLNPTTGAVDTTFNPNANFWVDAIALDNSGNPIIGGGLFTTIGSQPYIAKLNPSNGAADTTFSANANFNPNADGGYGAVNAIGIDSSGNLIVGGRFTSIGGQTRNHIAKLNPTTGAADTTFNPNTSGYDVNAIAIDSTGNLIVGGRFTSIGGQTRNNIAKLNPTTGAADTTFNPNANGDSFSAGDPNVDGSVSAIVIDPKKNILYTPNANFNGVDTFTYTAKDSSGVSTPITVNLLVNDSPVLDTSGTPTLTAINQGDTNNTGTLISTIIANFGGTKITDSDTDAKQGIAITNLDTTNGSWQYTTDGTTWNNTPAVSATNALLLASDANTKIRFLPSASYNGTVTNAITFAAWDQITGTNGSTANYTTDQTNNTTSSVFSSATETADITVVNPFPIITSVSATTPNGTYSIGKNIDITVNFSQIVNVTGTPQLSLAGATPVASYLSGSDSNTLTFRYTVAAGDSSPDLDYLSTTALSLRGGTIKNPANGDAILTLPSPAAANSLGANKAIVIDTIVPTVTSINRLATSPTAAATATYEIKFSQDVSGVDTGDFTLVSTGVNGASIGDLNAVDPKTYKLQVNTGAGSGSISLKLTDNDSIKNSLGVALGGANSGNGNLTGEVYDIDKTPPTGSLNAVADITIAGQSSQSLTVTFSDNNTVDVSSLDSYDALINWSGGDITAQFVSVDTNSSGTPRTATYSFTPPDGSWDYTDNGTYTVKLQGSQVKDSLGNLNAATSLGNFNVNIADPVPIPTILNQPNSVENTILGVSGIQIGTAENDEFLGSNSGNIFDAKSGDDNLYGGDNNDIFHGNEGNDFITGGDGNDILYGEANNDIILGELGSDLIFGGKGNDSLNGHQGNDIILGDRDDDLIDGGNDNDTLYGGKGDDIMLGSQGDDYLFGNQGADTIYGGEGNDLIGGNEQTDILGGGEGNDTLYGGADNDTLTGDTGDDRLYGDRGNDSLIGGSGSDIFVLNAGQGFDIIADFTGGQDLIGLTGGLSFGQLEITQNTQGTLIKNLLTGEQLGVMVGVSANAITSANFMLI